MKKLVLFDIDGTLVRSGQKGVTYWKLRLEAVFNEVYKTPISFEIKAHDFNGMLDTKVMRVIATRLGISEDVFFAGFPKARKIFHAFLKKAVDAGNIRYYAIEDARVLVEKLHLNPRLSFGVITGNIEANAWLKLRSAGYTNHFDFGVFADEIEERADLVEEAVVRASKHFSHAFPKEHVIVVGDTVHDIRAAKAAGVLSVGVATGLTSSEKHLTGEGADLVVSSLMDERVLTLLGLRHHAKPGAF